jgi:hypothetical protein
MLPCRSIIVSRSRGTIWSGRRAEITKDENSAGHRDEWWRQNSCGQVRFGAAKTAIAFGKDGDENASRRCDKVDALVSSNDCPGEGFLSSRESPRAS